MNIAPPPKATNIIASNQGSQEKFSDLENQKPLPSIKPIKEDVTSSQSSNNGNNLSDGDHGSRSGNSTLKQLFKMLEPKGCLKERDEFALYIFAESNKCVNVLTICILFKNVWLITSYFRFRRLCRWIVERKWFDNVVLLFIALNCITLAMERPNIPPDSVERAFLGTANYVFTAVFALEMFVKVQKEYLIFMFRNHIILITNFRLSPQGCFMVPMLISHQAGISWMDHLLLYQL